MEAREIEIRGLIMKACSINLNDPKAFDQYFMTVDPKGKSVDEKFVNELKKRRTAKRINRLSAKQLKKEEKSIGEIIFCLIPVIGWLACATGCQPPPDKTRKVVVVEGDIDPSKDCENYQNNKILDEIKVQAYADSTEITSKDINMVKSTIGKIDYRFTQGISSVNIYPSTFCKKAGILQENPGDEEKKYCKETHYFKEINGIVLCKGKDQAMQNDFESELFLKWSIYRAVGYHVAMKIKGKEKEFYDILKKSPIGWPESQLPFVFADSFSRYALDGEGWRREASRYSQRQAEYDWLKSNLFCNRDYGQPKIVTDPSKDCAEYQPGQLTESIEMKVIQPARFSAGDIQKVRNIIANMDQRFPDGIDRIELYERKKCEARAYYASDYIDNKICRGYSTGKSVIGLCRDTGEEKKGAFVDIDILFWTVYHETGHHVDYKISKKVLEYRNLLKQLYPKEWEYIYPGEYFAEDFAKYNLGGPYWKRLIEIDPDKNKAAKSEKRYSWMKNNVFCGREFSENKVGGEQDWYAYSFMHSDCSRAKLEYEKLIKNFASSPRVPSAYLGAGDAEACLGNCAEAQKNYEYVAKNYTKYADSAMFAIANNFEHCFEDIASALEMYWKIVEQYPNSTNSAWALFAIAGIYRFDQGSCSKAIPVYQQIVNKFADQSDPYFPHLVVDLAMLGLGSCYFEAGQCNKAVTILEDLLERNPDASIAAQAQQIMDYCKK